MGFKKIFAILLILVTLGLTLGTVGAGFLDPIELGDITKDDFVATSTGEDELDLDYSVEVDISDLSDDDKKSFEDALDDNDTSFILNMTTDYPMNVSMKMPGLPDKAEIKGDTLYVENSHVFSMISGLGVNDLKIDSISFNTTSGQLFFAEK